ncbi:MAG: hypothetical protein WBA17_07335 [Saprospiraceae bacterium]
MKNLTLLFAILLVLATPLTAQNFDWINKTAGLNYVDAVATDNGLAVLVTHCYAFPDGRTFAGTESINLCLADATPGSWSSLVYLDVETGQPLDWVTFSGIQAGGISKQGDDLLVYGHSDMQPFAADLIFYDTIPAQIATFAVREERPTVIRFGPDLSVRWAENMTVDVAGYVFSEGMAAGPTTGTYMYYQTGSNCCNGSDNQSSSSPYYLEQLDEDGNSVWVKIFNFSNPGGNGSIVQLAADAEGNLLVLLKESGGYTIDGVVLPSTPFGSGQLLKFSPAGELIWRKLFTAPVLPDMEQLAIGPDDGIYLAGRAADDFAIEDADPGLPILLPAGGFVLKFTEEGELDHSYDFDLPDSESMDLAFPGPDTVLLVNDQIRLEPAGGGIEPEGFRVSTYFYRLDSELNFLDSALVFRLGLSSEFEDFDIGATRVASLGQGDLYVNRDFQCYSVFGDTVALETIGGSFGSTTCATGFAGRLNPAYTSVTTDFVSDVEDELSAAFAVRVYPNPAATFLRVDLGRDAPPVFELTLFDASLRRVRALPAYRNQDALPLTGLPTGTYYLRVTADGRSGMRVVLVR